MEKKLPKRKIGQDPNQKEKFQNTSHYCKKKGHIVKDCYKLKGKEKTPDMASVAKDSTDLNDSIITECLGVDCPHDVWILDSRCSYHMSSDKSLFTSYRVCNDGMVTMGNNIACKAIRIGTIQIKLHDGVVRTLTMFIIFLR